MSLRHTKDDENGFEGGVRWESGRLRMKVGQDNGAKQPADEYDLDADGHNGL
jgi:hypothetical protein